MAVDVLIMAQNKTHLADSERARAALWKRGDIVSVYPGGQLGPHAHAGGMFCVVHIPGPITVSEFQEKYYGPETDGVDGMGTMLSRSRWKLAVEDLPARLQNDFDSTKRIDTTGFSDISPYIEDKRTRRRANADF